MMWLITHMFYVWCTSQVMSKRSEMNKIKILKYFYGSKVITLCRETKTNEENNK